MSFGSNMSFSSQFCMCRPTPTILLLGSTKKNWKYLVLGGDFTAQLYWALKWIFGKKNLRKVSKVKSVNRKLWQCLCWVSSLQGPGNLETFPLGGKSVHSSKKETQKNNRRKDLIAGLRLGMCYNLNCSQYGVMHIIFERI